jgi:FkbM family methyltransferase
MIGQGPIDTRRTIAMPGLGDGSLVLTPARRGLFLCNRHDIVGVSLVEYGEWAEPEVALIASLLRPGDVAIECGANVGTMTVPMAQAVGPRGVVHALELQPYFVRLLNANLALNGIQNVAVRQMAVGAADGTMRLPAMTYDRPVNFSGISFAATPTDGSGTGRSIPVRPLDGMFRGLTQLRLLKMDIENMEPVALAGATALIRRLQPIVYMECRTADSFSAARTHLGAHGYRLFWHGFRGYNAANYRGNAINRFGQQGDANLLAWPPGSKETAPVLPPAEDFSDIERLWPGLLGAPISSHPEGTAASL